MPPEIKLFFAYNSDEYHQGYLDGYRNAMSRIKDSLHKIEKQEEPFSNCTTTINLKKNYNIRQHNKKIIGERKRSNKIKCKHLNTEIE